eukprot:gene6814-12345_t
MGSGGGGDVGLRIPLSARLAHHRPALDQLSVAEREAFEQGCPHPIS